MNGLNSGMVFFNGDEEEENIIEQKIQAKNSAEEALKVVRMNEELEKKKKRKSTIVGCTIGGIVTILLLITIIAGYTFLNVNLMNGIYEICEVDGYEDQFEAVIFNSKDSVYVDHAKMNVEKLPEYVDGRFTFVMYKNTKAYRFVGPTFSDVNHIYFGLDGEELYKYERVSNEKIEKDYVGKYKIDRK